MVATGIKIVGIASVALFLSVLLTEVCWATSPTVTSAGSPDASVETITGEVMKISSELYIIRDTHGNRTLLQVSKNTQVEEAIRDGDTVLARIASDGHALSISKSSAPANSGPRHAGASSKP
jgi:hypothetical protein